MNANLIGLLAALGLAVLALFAGRRHGPTKGETDAVDEIVRDADDQGRRQRDDAVRDARDDAAADRRLPLLERARQAIQRARDARRGR